MNKLPHEYLLSKYRDDITITFKKNNGRHVVILRVKKGKLITECSEMILSSEVLGEQIRDAEKKLVEEFERH